MLVIIHVFSGEDIINTPISQFKVECCSFFRCQRKVVRRLVELIATEVITPWGLRDKEFTSEEILEMVPSEIIFTPSRGVR